MRSLILFCFLLLPTVSLAKGDKAPPISISFHLQDFEKGGEKMVFKWKTTLGELWFRQGASFKTRDIEAHRPFPSPHNDDGYGMIFKLDKDSVRRLKLLTTDNNGKHLLVLMNGKAVDMLRIDKPVTDGIICVWRGLSASDVRKADTLGPRIGEDKKKWKERQKKAGN